MTFPKTRTRRIRLVADARRILGTYRHREDGHPQAAFALADAIAQLEVALYLETDGRFGDQHSGMSRVLHKQKRP